MIHITDKQTDLLVGLLDNELKDKEYWNDVHKDSINNFETFDFTAKANVEVSKHLTGQNRLLIPGDRPDTWREFVIFHTYKSSDSTIEVKSNGSYVELAKEPILTRFDLGGVTAQTAMEYGLVDTEWKVGQIDYAGVREIKSDDRIDRYSFLLQVAEAFGMTLNFRVEIWGNKIVGRYVDLLHRVGGNNGKEVVLGKDLINVTRHESTEDVVTALVVEGPENESGGRISVTIENEQARQRWGRNGRHRWGYYEIETDNKEITTDEVISLGTDHLEKLINSTVKYTVDAVSLEHIFGLSHERAVKGDSVRVKDVSFDPPLYLDAEIIEVERSPSNPKMKKFVLGEFIEYSADEVMATFRKLQKQLAEKVGREDVISIVVDREIVRNPYPPEAPDVDDLWLDTSVSPNILYRWNGSEWIKGSPTEPGDIGAVPPEYVDMQSEVTRLRMEVGTVQDTRRSLSVEVNALNNNSWLVGNPVLSSLALRYDLFDDDATALITAINDAVADSFLTVLEEQEIDNARAEYRSSLDTLIDYIREAEDEIIRVSANEVIEYGERKIFKGPQSPDPAKTEELDLWIDSSILPPVWRQYMNGSWTKFTRTNISDMQGVISSTQVGDDVIQTPHLASNAVTSKHIAANVIDSNMISTAGLDAGVITYGTMTGITADVTQAGMTATGTLSSSTRFWAGSTYAGRNSAPFRVTQAGKMYASDVDVSGGTVDVGNAGLASTYTNDGAVRFWAGSTYAGRYSAPFMVTQDGTVYASKMNVIGGSIDIDENATIGQYLYLRPGFTDTGIVFGGSGASIQSGDSSLVVDAQHLYARYIRAYSATFPEQKEVPVIMGASMNQDLTLSITNTGRLYVYRADGTYSLFYPDSTG